MAHYWSELQVHPITCLSLLCPASCWCLCIINKEQTGPGAAEIEQLHFTHFSYHHTYTAYCYVLEWQGSAQYTTVSLGKGFSFKRKQHYKRTASETQTRATTSDPNVCRWNPYIFSKASQARHKNLPYHHGRPVYQTLQDNEVLSFTLEAVNLDLKIWQFKLCSLFACDWLCGSAYNRPWKHGAGGAAADRTQGYQSEYGKIHWASLYYYFFCIEEEDFEYISPFSVSLKLADPSQKLHLLN